MNTKMSDSKKSALLMMSLFMSSVLTGAWAQASSSIEVEVTGVRNTKGNICLLLFSSPEGFPDQSANAFQLLEVPAQIGTVTAAFSGIPSGTYGISVLHDANKNRTLDKNWLGIPREAYGISKNARRNFGPPSFKAARFSHPGNATTTIRLWIK